MTIPLPLTFPYLLVFWPVYAWVFAPEFRLMRQARVTALGPAEDRGSVRVLVLAFALASTAAWVIAFLVPSATIVSFRLAVYLLGVVAIFAGGLLRRSCFRTLGHFFTGAITIQPDHRVIDCGPYRFVRHPSYSAALLLLAGIGLTLTNWLSIIVCLVVGLAAYTYRAHIEEQALLSALGTPYAQFMATRKRFIPYVY